ncbi:RHS repeat domain-containing protein [Gimesia fumaroli]|uniref:tRNA3(Ser)-specific nuclease WapA n=1 Tax=Gimesia fumaroli TaxID=2527976 RepID=A0A518I5U5_9PLAN|nr:RHS repeat-associated core domain-containing protein [Gimesia fumaroli]QDV48443.1 tRNA3(Ser)-specific nuclease WapA precursor [Gimesia fumaroli]
MTVTNYLWSLDSYLEEFDEFGQQIISYTNEPAAFGSLISQNKDNQSAYFHFDAQGSTHQLTDSSANITDTFSYDAWGNQLTRTGTSDVYFQYIGEAGYYYDSEVDSYYVRVRIYNPATSRWDSTDPFGFVDGLNSYLYSHNSPTQYFDPSGAITIIRTVSRLNPTCKNLFAYVRWTFRLDKWPCRGSEGIFVQRVTVNCMVCDCDPKVPCVQNNFKYWEAWHVTKSKSKSKYTVVHDNAGFGASGGRGHYRQSGRVKFYCIAPEGAPAQDDEFSKNELPRISSGSAGEGPCTTSSINLPIVPEEEMDKKKRELLDRNPADGPSKRVFNMQWNCCCCEKWASANARP